MEKNNDEVSDRSIKKMMKEYGAKNEEEFQTIIYDKWNISQCIICGKMLDLTTCAYDDGDPICFGGCSNG